MLLLIDNYDSFTYNLLQIVEENSVMEYEVLKYDEIDSETISRFDKVLISPGPGIPDDFPNLEKWVREFGDKKSFLGICLGHEAIALAYEAKLRKLDGVFHGISKKTTVLKTDEYIFRGLPEVFEVGLYHSWALDELSFPNELDVTAKAYEVAMDSKGGQEIIMAFSHRKYDCKGLQFHPESIMTKVGEKILKNWLVTNAR
jgi:anthranilate synthase component 2